MTEMALPQELRWHGHCLQAIMMGSDNDSRCASRLDADWLIVPGQSVLHNLLDGQ